MLVDITPKKLIPKHIIMAASGEVVAGVPGAVLRFYRMSAGPSADLSGLATFNDGVTSYYGTYDWKAGSEYGYDENAAAYIELPTGLGLDITLPSSTNTAVNVLYEVSSP